MQSGRRARPPQMAATLGRQEGARRTEKEGRVGLEVVDAVGQARAREAPAVVEAVQRVQPRHEHVVQRRACARAHRALCFDLVAREAGAFARDRVVLAWRMLPQLRTSSSPAPSGY